MIVTTRKQIQLNLSEHEGRESASTVAGLAIWRQSIGLRFLQDVCRQGGGEGQADRVPLFRHLDP